MPARGQTIAIPTMAAFTLFLISLPWVTESPETVISFAGEDPVFGFAEITVINVQSYPSVGGNWEVMFETVGKADLTVTAVDGTEFGTDLDFINLSCGENVLTTELTNGKIFVPDYECSETGNERSKVLTTGKHHLEFDFGGQTAYAHNQTTDMNVYTSACIANDEADEEDWDNLCVGGPDADNDYLNFDDEFVEIHGDKKRNFHGVKTTTAEWGIEDCAEINNVILYYLWWGDVAADTTHYIDVSDDGSAWYRAISAQNPASEGSLNNVDVTSLDGMSWNCEDFGTGGTAGIKSNIVNNAADAFFDWDVLHFVVTYTPLVNTAPDITSVSNDNNDARYGTSVTWTGDCTDTGGDNFRLLVCKSNELTGAACDTGSWCEGTNGTDVTPSCSYTTVCGDVGVNQAYYATCCDDEDACDATLVLGTFDVNDSFTYDTETVTPAEAASQKYCEADTFTISAVTDCSSTAVNDATVDVTEGGTILCSDSTGSSGNYSCTDSDLSIGSHTWFMNIMKAGFDTNTTPSRNYTVNNDTFAAGNWFPIDDSFQPDSITIDFNVANVENSCGTAINDATVMFRDVTESALICSDSTGSAGFYSCQATSGTAPLNEAEETWDFNITRTGFDSYDASPDRNMGIEILTDLSFAMFYPASGCVQGQGSWPENASGTCDKCFFENTGLCDENQVACQGQVNEVDGPSFFFFDNQSTSSNDLDWEIDLNAALPSTLKLKMSQANDGWQAICTAGAAPSSGCVDVNNDSRALIGNSIALEADLNAWAWADFIGVSAGGWDRNTIHYSSESLP